MSKLKFILIWCLLLGAFVSCGDKEDEENPEPAAELDYLPTTKGSTWAYGGIMPYSYRITGETKVIDGKTFYELEVTQGTQTSTSYLRKEKGVYTAMGLVPNSGNLKIDVLKDNVPVGESWEQMHTIQGAETKRVSTIMEKGSSKTVEGKTYQDVIHVKVATTYFYGGMQVVDPNTAHYYFAKGVGLILTELESLGQVPLLTYDVK
ncbi:hypothetical protein [Pontibacter actiniarum]|uniref:Lipoprotein n=1 Tax=Pontibacter actiniarum TaxID=323450 RepID=A0A1X9YNX6_9BACT|nr:hypothetical protein [Pontibacter actiniarum]ARS34583.1 hypothetical protein CA264_03505 [Pontibacter actiniarum]